MTSFTLAHLFARVADLNEYAQSVKRERDELRTEAQLLREQVSELQSSVEELRHVEPEVDQSAEMVRGSWRVLQRSGAWVDVRVPASAWWDFANEGRDPE